LFAVDAAHCGGAKIHPSRLSSRHNAFGIQVRSRLASLLQESGAIARHARRLPII
jgi:hypothetical protein